MKEYLEHLCILFYLITKHKVRLCVAKNYFCSESVGLLGPIVNKESVNTYPNKIGAVQKVPKPPNMSRIRSFHGPAGLFCRFIKDFAEISTHPHAITSPNLSFSWREQAQSAFKNVKMALTIAQVFNFEDFDEPFIVEADASSKAAGAVLAWKPNCGAHLI